MDKPWAQNGSICVSVKHDKKHFLTSLWFTMIGTDTDLCADIDCINEVSITFNNDLTRPNIIEF